MLLVINRDKPEAANAADRVRALVGGHGRLVGECEASNGAPPPEAERAELIVVLGGDGTLIAQSRRFADVDRPLLGINLGKLGFLAEFDLETFAEQASTLMRRGTLPERRVSMVRATVTPGSGGPARVAGSALNECVVTAGPPYRMIVLSLRIGGEDGPTVSGDGLIVSTPTGSTAYNLSAGGPILAPDVGAMVITPIAAHSLTFRPIVVAADARIEFRMVRVNAPPGPERGNAPGTTLVLDGQVQTPLAEGDVVAIERDPRAVRFVRNPMGGYWRTLIEKMQWATPPRLRDT